jgi:hypothetical protein
MSTGHVMSHEGLQVLQVLGQQYVGPMHVPSVGFGSQDHHQVPQPPQSSYVSTGSG